MRVFISTIVALVVAMNKPFFLEGGVGYMYIFFLVFKLDS
jgi:hypothetical protein